MLEVKIEELTKAIVILTELISKIEAGKSEPVKLDPKIEAALPIVEAAIAKPVIVTYTPEDQAVAKEIIAAIDKTAMPAPPSFEPVVEAAPVANAAPFTDGKGLIDYVMTVYKELGAEKGAGIQGVLAEMGLNNVNEVRPAEYGTFFAKVEALK